jgi:hypothetical protein
MEKESLAGIWTDWRVGISPSHLRTSYILSKNCMSLR